MSDFDGEDLFERAGAALRAPSSGDEEAREALVEAIRAEARRPRTPLRGATSPWWMALAAAAVAFAAGLGMGRSMGQRSARALTATFATAVASDSVARHVEFVFVAPSARNVALVGDFNGWDATATPMRRTDGRATWSVSVPLAAGRHVYAFVVDGNDWVPDPQAPLSPEQWFGQRNSVVVVPVGDRRS
jgi:hypothetical protein